MTDIVSIEGLAIDCVIGVWDWERQITQRLYVDIEAVYDISAAAKSDALSDTLNYAALAEATISLAERAQCQLIETLADRIAEQVLKDFATSHVHVTVHKPGAIPGARDVRVRIERKITEESGESEESL
ncbi:dihydroneopterin aldolase [Gammaproteobacteria bacterium]|nr:dihydroneopterin aldolase [Gammaproteobacteria bacterium]